MTTKEIEEKISEYRTKIKSLEWDYKNALLNELALKGITPNTKVYDKGLRTGIFVGLKKVWGGRWDVDIRAITKSGTAHGRSSTWVSREDMKPYEEEVYKKEEEAMEERLSKPLEL